LAAVLSFGATNEGRAAEFRTASEIASASAAHTPRLPTTLPPDSAGKTQTFAASAPPRQFPHDERAAVVAIMANTSEGEVVEDAALYVGFFQEIECFGIFIGRPMVLSIKFGANQSRTSEVRS